MERSQALMLAKETLKLAVFSLNEAGLSDIIMCPETMGKQNQLGTVSEVCELCLLDEKMIPCVDFGHLYARSLGKMNDAHAFSLVLDEIKNTIGTERLHRLHIHFSHIEYTPGGEKKHLNFKDGLFGPDFEPLCSVLVDYGVEPVVISESAGDQDIDALNMMNVYKGFINK